MQHQSKRKGALLLMPELQIELGGRSRQFVYDKLRNDPDFPKPIKTGPHSIAWRRDEFEEWLHNLPRAEPTGLSSVEMRKMAQGARAAA